MKTKEYKGYIGYYTYNDAEGYYSGYIQKKDTNILSVLRFYGSTSEETLSMFKKAIDMGYQYGYFK
mgnify:FL=1